VWLKAADIAAIGADYPRAIKNYEKVAEWSVNNNMMRYSVKEYLLKSGLCNLALDYISGERCLERYREIDPNFAKERECVLLTNLVDAVREQDQDKFADHLFKFDQVQRLDKWKTDICLRIKNAITAKQDSDDEFA
jgi:alpha-soluble NSF attachment protein